MRKSCALLFALAGASICGAQIPAPTQAAPPQVATQQAPPAPDKIISLRFREPITQIPKCEVQGLPEFRILTPDPCYTPSNEANKWVVYNLLAPNSQLHHQFWAYTRENLVVSAESNFDPREAEQFINALTAKFGPPVDDKSKTISNAMGATATDRMITWKSKTLVGMLFTRGVSFNLGYFTVMTVEELKRTLDEETQKGHAFDHIF